MFFQTKYLKYINKLLFIKNNLKGGHETGKTLNPTPQMIASKKNNEYYDNFIKYLDQIPEIDNIWLIIGAGNKDTESGGRDLTRFRDNYDIAITAGNEFINIEEPKLIALHADNVPPGWMSHKNIRNKFSKIIYDWSTTKSIRDIFYQIQNYCVMGLKIGGILYTDNLRGLHGVQNKMIFKKVSDGKYSIYNYYTQELIIKETLNYENDIRTSISLSFNDLQIYNCATLFKKIEDDNTISLANIEDHIKNYNTSELGQENITNKIKDMLSTPRFRKNGNFIVEYVNEIYPNNNGSDMTNFYKITKLAPENGGGGGGGGGGGP